MGLTAREFEQYIIRNRKEFMTLSKQQERELGRLYISFAERAKMEAAYIVNKEGLTYAAKQQLIRDLLKEAAKLTDNFKHVLDKALLESAGLKIEADRIIMSGYQQRLSGIGVDLDLEGLLQQIPDKTVRLAYSRIWEDGLKLSDRIWQLDRRTRGELQRIITEELAAGRSASSKILEARLNKLLVPDRRFVRTQLHGRNVAFDAARLLRTERTVAYREADRQAAMANPGARGIKWKLSPAERNCATCSSLASADDYGLGPGVYPIDKVPITPHPQCYDDETEVYTNEGWKYFKDLNGKEWILSVNPENQNIEWSGYKNHVSYKYSGKLIQFKKIKYEKKEKSRNLRKQSALKKNKINVKKEYLLKSGKLKEEDLNPRNRKRVKITVK